jgi:polysaccharide deacetylase 2 family uncharacterized protein YibQ
MKLFKKLFTVSVILLIVASIAGIIYVSQFKEEPPVKKEPRKEARQVKTKKSKTEKSKLLPPKVAVKKQIAIIIDDIGYDLKPVKELLKINADLTFAVLPGLSHSSEAAQMLRKAKKEILLHLPMEPLSYPNEKPGEGALFTDMNDEEIIFQLRKNIKSVPNIAGVNNHMGSKFMMNEDKLALIFRELKKKNLFFIDSRTSAETKAEAAANKVGLPMSERKIFIDNDRDYKKIYNNLINISKANDNTPVILIGHPYPETILAIKDATKVLRDQGISIVPVSKIIAGKKS